MHMHSHWTEVKIISNCIIKTFHLYKYKELLPQKSDKIGNA